MDPPGCKDIDDALHVRELENGNLELGVHIADVTHFLASGTAMDDEASIRFALSFANTGLESSATLSVFGMIIISSVLAAGANV